MAHSLVTGGFGFVGRHLVRMLMKRGDSVTVFDVVPASPFLEDIKDKIKVKVGDFANWVHIAEAIRADGVETLSTTSARRYSP